MKKLKIKRVILLLLVLGLFAFGSYTLISNLPKKANVKKPVEVINEIKKYGYTLDENETKEYKSNFTDLKKVLEKTEIDEEKYAELVATLFVYDFYHLDNKVTNSDIGGVQFIHTNARDNFILKAQDTIYKYVYSNINDDRTQILPKVKNVVSKGVFAETYKYGKTEDKNAYKVVLTIEYVTDLGYPTEVTVNLIHEDNKLSIVEIN